MQSYSIRNGMIDDLPFLEEMLYEAVFWNPEIERRPREEIFAVPDIAKILADWGNREGDFSLIAIDSNNNKAGAIWYRFWSRRNKSFGFVDADTPEIGLSIIKEMRGRGIGTELLKWTIESAKSTGVKKLGLSVEENNPAKNLYSKFGFKKVIVVENSWTMVLKI
jgi:ribosomal-protein-alanine N-acetyltransferase